MGHQSTGKKDSNDVGRNLKIAKYGVALVLKVPFRMLLEHDGNKFVCTVTQTCTPSARELAALVRTQELRVDRTLPLTLAGVLTELKV